MKRDLKTVESGRSGRMLRDGDKSLTGWKRIGDVTHIRQGIKGEKRKDV